MRSDRVNESDSTPVKIFASMNEIRTNRRKQMLRKAESKSIVPQAGKPGIKPVEREVQQEDEHERWVLNGSVLVIRRLDIDSPRIS